ncbi:MAG: ATP-binding protein [Pseudomonadales bacterium]
MATSTIAKQTTEQRSGEAGHLAAVAFMASTESAFELVSDNSVELSSAASASDNNPLQTAVDGFDGMSGQLMQAYHVLELEAIELRAELAKTQARRDDEVAAKERITGRLQGLLTALPVGVVVLDVRGRVLVTNPAAIDLLGEPLEGESWVDIIQRVFAPRFDDGHEVSLKDGRRVSIATRSLDGEPGQLIVLTDMTETRALQEHLSRHKRLSALGKVSASLAHQIRTPLSAAMLYGEHLLNGNLEPEQQQRFAGKLMSRLNHLEQQVRDMLVFTRGDMPLANIVTTQELVTGLEAAMESPLSASQSDCQVTNNARDAVLQCNRDSLVGAILNLVNNAIEVVVKQAHITITLDIVNDQQLQVRVTDQGPGIPAAILADVSEAFYTTKPQGTGLGLSVVQGVVRAHQGEFSIESSADNGTQMTLLLPLKVQSNEEEMV